MAAAGMRSPAISASARPGRREAMGHGPVMLEAMDLSGRRKAMGRNLVTGRNPVTGHSPAMTGATDLSGRREAMGHNPVTPGAMDLSRPLATKRRATTRRRPSCTDRLTTDPESIMVRAGAGEDGGGGRSSLRSSQGAECRHKDDVGATVVVALLAANAVRRRGNHKGRPTPVRA